MSLQLNLLSTLQPPCSTRTWQSTPHQSLPILATACSDKTVRIYSLTSFTLLTTVSGGHRRSIRCVDWKPGTQQGEAILATGSFDASAGIWKKHYSGRQIDGLGKANAIERADDEDTDEIDVDDDDEYSFTVLLDGHESEIKSLAFSSTSRLLATCSRDKSVWIWEDMDDDNWETVAVLQEHDGDVKCLAWHPSEELLVSASYDDTIRLYREDVDDWVQVAVIEGHGATVWSVQFEGFDLPGCLMPSSSSTMSQAQQDYLAQRKLSGPRLLSCSDDLDIRIWERKPRETTTQAAYNSKIPSSIRSQSIDEEWQAAGILPRVHERAIYSISWSPKTGRIVSTGSDGKIVVYEEQWCEKDINESPTKNGALLGIANLATQWTVIAQLEAAHDVFEVNHVVWAKRWDRARRRDDEEVIISTGDDGEVKVWVLENAQAAYAS